MIRNTVVGMFSHCEMKHAPNAILDCQLPSSFPGRHMTCTCSLLAAPRLIDINRGFGRIPVLQLVDLANDGGAGPCAVVGVLTPHGHFVRSSSGPLWSIIRPESGPAHLALGSTLACAYDDGATWYRASVVRARAVRPGCIRSRLVTNPCILFLSCLSLAFPVPFPFRPRLGPQSTPVKIGMMKG